MDSYQQFFQNLTPKIKKYLLEISSVFMELFGLDERIMVELTSIDNGLPYIWLCSNYALSKYIRNNQIQLDEQIYNYFGIFMNSIGASTPENLTDVLKVTTSIIKAVDIDFTPILGWLSAQNYDESSLLQLSRFLRILTTKGQLQPEVMELFFPILSTASINTDNEHLLESLLSTIELFFDVEGFFNVSHIESFFIPLFEADSEEDPFEMYFTDPLSRRGFVLNFFAHFEDEDLALLLLEEESTFLFGFYINPQVELLESIDDFNIRQMLFSTFAFDTDPTPYIEFTEDNNFQSFLSLLIAAKYGISLDIEVTSLLELLLEVTDKIPSDCFLTILVYLIKFYPNLSAFFGDLIPPITTAFYDLNTMNKIDFSVINDPFTELFRSLDEENEDYAYEFFDIVFNSIPGLLPIQFESVIQLLTIFISSIQFDLHVYLNQIIQSYELLLGQNSIVFEKTSILLITFMERMESIEPGEAEFVLFIINQILGCHDDEIDFYKDDLGNLLAVLIKRTRVIPTDIVPFFLDPSIQSSNELFLVLMETNPDWGITLVNDELLESILSDPPFPTLIQDLSILLTYVPGKKLEFLLSAVDQIKEHHGDQKDQFRAILDKVRQNDIELYDLFYQESFPFVNEMYN